MKKQEDVRTLKRVEKRIVVDFKFNLPKTINLKLVSTWKRLLNTVILIRFKLCLFEGLRCFVLIAVGFNNDSFLSSASVKKA